MFLNVLLKCFQVPVPAVWKSFILAGLGPSPGCRLAVKARFADSCREPLGAVAVFIAQSSHGCLFVVPRGHLSR